MMECGSWDTKSEIYIWYSRKSENFHKDWKFHFTPQKCQKIQNPPWQVPVDFLEGCSWDAEWWLAQASGFLSRCCTFQCRWNLSLRRSLKISQIVEKQRTNLKQTIQTGEVSWEMKMFSMLLLLLPAIACIARDPTEGKEKVHSFEVKYNVSFPPRRELQWWTPPNFIDLIISTICPQRASKRREKRQIVPESFLPGDLPHFKVCRHHAPTLAFHIQDPFSEHNQAIYLPFWNVYI